MRDITPQEEFWRGAFGDEYVDRNNGPELVSSNLALFSSALSRTRNVKSIMEFGTNRGLNLIALRQLLPHCRLSGLEINATAHAAASALGIADVMHGSIFDFAPTQPADLALVKGVLIHLDPNHLPQAYEIIYQAAQRYILLVEYYNPTPVEIPYRGHEDRLFKRDFAGDMLDQYSDLELLDYGFSYRRDPAFPGSDCTWFLMERRAALAAAVHHRV